MDGAGKNPNAAATLLFHTGEVSMDAMVQQISEVLGNGFTRQSSHGFWTLFWVSG